MTLSFAFGDPGEESKGELGMGLPLLGGDARETILGEVESTQTQDGLRLSRGQGCLVGWIRSGTDVDLEGETRRLYGLILRSAKGLALYRMWNSVPRINEDGAGKLENYRAFCRGRSIAFESVFGADFARSLPASTAVGTLKTGLTVAFLAGPMTARHFENPAQVPAYEYPPEHGPRPPSFARATVVERNGTSDVFIAGTSAITGHATVAPHHTSDQLRCTLENLRLISRECGLGDRLGASTGHTRHFKVYLRNPSDYRATSDQMQRDILIPGDRVSYLSAEICRSALNIEIEVAVRGADRS
jgi:chorismate lyase / 3-hydroxybenzoate synthase